MAGLTDAQFDALWNAFTAKATDLQQQIVETRLGQGRAELAGAVEVVADLPDPGQKGRVMYSTVGLSPDGEGFYGDKGTTWVFLG